METWNPISEEKSVVCLREGSAIIHSCPVNVLLWVWVEMQKSKM